MKKKFGIIGNPIKHSLSPILHQYWFKKYGIDADYSIIEAIDKNLPEEQNFKAFELYINKSKSKYVTSFLNLNKDTLLVIPIPKKNKNYATLKDFCDNSSITQKKYFWKKVSKLVKKFMKNQKYVWISTHGLGVPYMHIRISNKPKYYFDNELKKI